VPLFSHHEDLETRLGFWWNSATTKGDRHQPTAYPGTYSVTEASSSIQEGDWNEGEVKSNMPCNMNRK